MGVDPKAAAPLKGGPPAVHPARPALLAPAGRLWMGLGARDTHRCTPRPAEVLGRARAVHPTWGARLVVGCAGISTRPRMTSRGPCPPGLGPWECRAPCAHVQVAQGLEGGWPASGHSLLPRAPPWSAEAGGFPVLEFRESGGGRKTPLQLLGTQWGSPGESWPWAGWVGEAASGAHEPRPS